MHANALPLAHSIRLGGQHLRHSFQVTMLMNICIFLFQESLLLVRDHCHMNSSNCVEHLFAQQRRAAHILLILSKCWSLYLSKTTRSECDCPARCKPSDPFLKRNPSQPSQFCVEPSSSLEFVVYTLVSLHQFCDR